MVQQATLIAKDELLIGNEYPTHNIAKYTPASILIYLQSSYPHNSTCARNIKLVTWSSHKKKMQIKYYYLFTTINLNGKLRDKLTTLEEKQNYELYIVLYVIYFLNRFIYLSTHRQFLNIKHHSNNSEHQQKRRVTSPDQKNYSN